MLPGENDQLLSKVAQSSKMAIGFGQMEGCFREDRSLIGLGLQRKGEVKGGEYR